MAKLKNRALALLHENRHRLCCTAVCLALLGLFQLANYSFLNVVTVREGDVSKTVISLFSDADDLIALAGMTPGDNDKVFYTTFPGRNADIIIKKTFNVPIKVDGNTLNAKLISGTVQNCLQNAGVLLGEHDYTEPSLHTPVENGDSIRVYRVEYKDTQYEEAVPYGTDYKSSSLTFRFKRRQYLLKAGSEGKNLVTYRERFVDGELESALVTKVEVVHEPVNELILKYSADPISPLEAPAGITVSNNVPSSYVAAYNMSATGYSAKRGRGASGLGLYCGTVAVNPAVIPYGSKLYITSPDGQFVYGFAIATDTGTAMMANPMAIDLFYETYKESSLNWRNNVIVYVLG